MGETPTNEPPPQPKPLWHEPHTDPQAVRRAHEHLDSLVPGARTRFTLIPAWLLLVIAAGLFVLFWGVVIAWLVWKGTGP